MFPNLIQKRKLREWINTSRYLYNQTVSELKNPTIKISKYDLRSTLVSNPKNQWERNTPQGIRENAVFDAYQAYSNGMQMLRNTGKTFDLKFRTKKADSQVIKLPVDAIKNDLRLYPSLLGAQTKIAFNKHERKNIKFRDKILRSKVRSQILEHEIQIQKTKVGKWYLLVPIEIVPKSSDNQGAVGKVISLDPGVFTFLTGYSPHGEILKFGDHDIPQIRNYLLKTDRLISLTSKLKGRRARRFKRAIARRHQKFKNLIKDCHRKVAKYLVDNYDLILLPKFETSQMSKRSSRNLHSKTVRSMYGWSHYKFRQMLICKAQENGKIVEHPTEEYTSKTCTNCGHQKENLGGSRKYSCSMCHLKMDRDIQGSRNIYLKRLGDNSR